MENINHKNDKTDSPQENAAKKNNIDIHHPTREERHAAIVVLARAVLKAMHDKDAKRNDQGIEHGNK
jgi:hypothetical protein